MNVEIVAEAAQFPEKEYMTGIAVALCRALPPWGLRREVGLASDGGQTACHDSCPRTRRCERPGTDNSESFGPLQGTEWLGLLGKELT